MIDSNIKFVDFSHQNNELSISRYIVKKAEIEELDVAIKLKIKRLNSYLLMIRPKLTIHPLCRLCPALS